MAEGTAKSKAPALTPDNVTKAVEGVEDWRWLGYWLKVPLSKRDEIGRKSSSDSERRKKVILFCLENDPTPSWRRILWALDRMEEEHHTAERIRQYCEPLTDPTLTHDNITTTLHTVPTKRWFESNGLVERLRVPFSKRDQIRDQSVPEDEKRTAVVNYWLGMAPRASWQLIAGAVYYLEEEAALDEARKHFQRPRDPTLTLNSLHTATKGVLSWSGLGSWIDVPLSKRVEIESQLSSNDQRLRVLLDVWLQTHPVPTWSLIAEALYQMEEYVLLKRVREQYITASEESRRLFEEAMQHGSVEAATTKVLITGIAGSGKTCSKEVILGRKPPEVRRSTPCAERPVRVLRVDPQSSEWSTVGPEKVKTFLAELIKARALGLIKTPSGTFIVTPDEPHSDVQHTESTKHVQREMPLYGSPNVQPNMVAHTSSEVTSTAAAGTPPESEAKVKPSGTEEDLVKLIEQSSGSDSVMNHQWVHFIDSGGQPHFHEVLPIFLRGTSVCLFVFKLSEELHDHPLVEYYDEKGEPVGKPYHADHTNEEILKQCITTMQSHKSQSATEDAPKIVILGTHKDKEDPHTRKAKNDKLLEMLLPDLQDDLIYYGESCKEVIFPLNARFPGPEEEKIADQIRRLIMSKCSPKPKKIPLCWYALEMLLRELAEALGTQVLDKRECFAKARSLHFNKKSFGAALKYLDSLNLIFYYDEVLPEVIFCDIQVPLDKVTELVKEIFRLRKNPAQGVSADRAVQKFRNHGVVTAEFLSKFEKHYVPDLFTAHELIKLFRALLIFADLDGSEYFMPCLLETLKSTEVESHRVSNNAAAAPLILHHSHGPRSGLFCSLISFLLSGDNQFPCPWQLVSKLATPECLYRNCIEFTIPKHPGTITLIDSFHYFEVHVALPPRVAARICPKFCPIVSDAVLAGLARASSTLGYDNSKPVKAFFCPCGDGNPHPATLGEDRSYWVCTRNPMECDDTDPNQLVWLPPKEHDVCTVLHYVPSHRDLMNEVAAQIPTLWREVGTELGLQPSELDCIEVEQSRKQIRCFSAIFSRWERQETSEYSWATLIRALQARTVRQNRLAQTLRDKYARV